MGGWKRNGGGMEGGWKGIEGGWRTNGGEKEEGVAGRTLLSCSSNEYHMFADM